MVFGFPFGAVDRCLVLAIILVSEVGQLEDSLEANRLVRCRDVDSVLARIGVISRRQLRCEQGTSLNRSDLSGTDTSGLGFGQASSNSSKTSRSRAVNAEIELGFGAVL